jgi:leader peptidase (prepilin peptidase)/N-methyltransferase
MIRSLSAVEIVVIGLCMPLAGIVAFAARLRVEMLLASIALVLAMVVWITVRDFRDYIIPDGPLVCIALVGIAVRLTLSPDDVPGAVAATTIDALVCGGALFVVREGFFRFRGIDGIGFGDVKLSLVCGILVGCIGFAWALFMASVAGLAVAVAVMALKPDSDVSRLPFGAFLAPVCWCVWIASLTEALT